MRRPIQGASVLVVGGAGFIGSHLCDRLLNDGAKTLVILDNFFLGRESNVHHALSQGGTLVRGDAEDAALLESLIRSHGINVVFNLATKALNYSFIDPADAYMTNVVVMKNLLELQRAGSFETLCHFSSSEVYGTAVYEPMDEVHPMFPTTTYAAGKAAADLLLMSYVNQLNLDAFIVRPFNNYGPRQNFQGPLAGIIPKTAKAILSGEAPELHGTGMQTRDFVFVRDTVEAVMRLYPVMKKGDSVNIAFRNQISMKQLVETIASVMRYTGQIVYKPRRTADVDCHDASNQKLLSLISMTPTSFDQGIRETLSWYQEHIQL